MDGSVDTGFNPGPNQAANSVAIQPDGCVIVGGYFTTFSPPGTPNPIPRNLHSPYRAQRRGRRLVRARQRGHRVRICGAFERANPRGRLVPEHWRHHPGYLARLNADGSLDKSFAPTLNGSVQSISIQSNGKYIIGGHFTVVDGLARNYVARMNTDGTFDGPFNPNPNSPVTMVAVEPNGQVLLGGTFNVVTPDGATAGTSVGSLIRVNSDGTLDTTFTPFPSGGSVYAAVILSDGNCDRGRILLGRRCQPGQPCEAPVQREPGPEPLDPQPNFAVYAMALQPNGQLLIGGTFTSVQPQTGKVGTATTLPTTTLANGTVQTYPPAGINATVPIYVNRLARLNTDGTLDTTFFPDPDISVLSIALQSNGSIVVGRKSPRSRRTAPQRG